MSQKINLLKISLFSLLMILGTELIGILGEEVNIKIKNDTSVPLYAAFFEVQGATTDGDNGESVRQINSMSVIPKKESKTIYYILSPGTYGRALFAKKGHTYSDELYITSDSKLFPYVDGRVKKGDIINANNKKILFLPIKYRGGPHDTKYDSITVTMDPNGNLASIPKGL